MTNRLYYDQSYLREFDATVLSARETPGGTLVLLDQSAFYPTSGGQPFDTGTLNALAVTDVSVDEAGDVWHTVSGTLREGDAVHGVIDWARRFDHMQQHAGEHMIAGAMWRLFQGGTIGLHLGADFSTIDVTMPDGRTHLSPEEIRAIEDDVNSQIQRDVPIRCWFPGEAELKSLPLRKPPTVSEHVRVVAIGDLEMVACGGTHPSSAGQIALVKIIDARPSKGKLRLSFVCGMRAVRLFQTLFGVCENAAAKLSSRPEQIAEGVERLKAAVSSLERELNETRQREALRKIDSLLDGAQMISGVPLVSAQLPEMPMDALRSLASGLIEREKCIALLASEKADGFNLVFARNPAIDADMGKLLREAATSCGGKGGGRGDFAQGSAKEARALELAVQILRGSL